MPDLPPGCSALLSLSPSPQSPLELSILSAMPLARQKISGCEDRPDGCFSERLGSAWRGLRGRWPKSWLTAGWAITGHGTWSPSSEGLFGAAFLARAISSTDIPRPIT
ncbi:hypothetical protein NMY22_g10307 [Coprinellus aureogranulatus]|nr:hypothetical protein NMY22_g10307 [Coprinellus aureogranulatus]